MDPLLGNVFHWIHTTAAKMYEGRIGQVADERKIRRLFSVGSFSQSTPRSIQSMWAAAKKKSDTKIRTGDYEQEQHRVIFHSHKIPNEYEYWRTQKFNLKQRNRFRSTAILAFTKCNVVMNSVSSWNWQHTFIIVEKAKRRRWTPDCKRQNESNQRLTQLNGCALVAKKSGTWKRAIAPVHTHSNATLHPLQLLQIIAIMRNEVGWAGSGRLRLE